MLTKYTKLNHSDIITIDKLTYVENEALFTGVQTNTVKVMNKHLYNIKTYFCIGEYSLNQDVICLLADGLKYFTHKHKRTLEKQISKTISHEIMHRVLFYEHGENECMLFDNIAQNLKEFGVY